MNLEKRKKDAIYGMALYVEECMQEIMGQLKKEDVPLDILARRINHASGTMEVLKHVMDDLITRE